MLLSAILIALLVPGAVSAALPPVPLVATPETGHVSGCFRTGNGEECCHAGPQAYHCH